MIRLDEQTATRRAGIKTHVSGQICVWVDGRSGHVELLGDTIDLFDERHDRLELFVGLSQGRLELGMSVDQTLDLVESVNDEHVDQVLSSSVQPVVEWLQGRRKINQNS